jgi:hypothetical protein
MVLAVAVVVTAYPWNFAAIIQWAIHLKPSNKTFSMASRIALRKNSLTEISSRAAASRAKSRSRGGNLSDVKAMAFFVRIRGLTFGP